MKKISNQLSRFNDPSDEQEDDETKGDAPLPEGAGEAHTEGQL